MSACADLAVRAAGEMNAASAGPLRGLCDRVLPMGSLYEGAQYLVFECLVLMLRDRLGVGAAAMRATHTNLE